MYFHADSISEAVGCTLCLPTFFDSTTQHLHCVVDSSGHGPRTLCRGQNNRKTTMGRTVPSFPCLTWKSCLSLTSSNMLGLKRGENYLKFLREKPQRAAAHFPLLVV